jgi:hypothetical protein
MFENLEPEESWFRDPAKIEAKLREIALGSLSYAAALISSSRVRRRVGNVSVMPKGCHGKAQDDLVALMTAKASDESARTQLALRNDEVEQLVRSVYKELSDSLQGPSDAWKSVIPGKQILAQFASEVGMDLSRYKLAYLAQTTKMSSPVFDEIVSIFEEFSSTP